MRAARLARKRAFLERGVVWLAFGLVPALGVIALGGAIDLGLLRDFELFPAILRGYTPLGTLLGVLAASAALLTLFYSLRRRSLQESLPLARGTLAMWLWSHVTLGTLSLIFACVHAGYGSFSLQPSLGKVVLALLVVSALGGTFWRIVYGRVPSQAARSVGNYAASESLLRARAQEVEVFKLAAGRSARLQALVERVLTTRVDAAEAGRAAAELGPQESAIFAEVARLASERHAALARARGQTQFLARLQGPRVLHVPVSLLFVALLPLHVLTAYDVPEKLFHSTQSGAGLAFEPSARCSRCHQRIVEEWRGSMHAHALSSPIMRAQTNLAARTTLAAAAAPDPKYVCVNCHGPLAARLSKQATLPLPAPSLGAAELSSEGIGCLACHAFDGPSQTGSAALDAFADHIQPGRSYFGPYDEPVGNAFHRSERAAAFAAPEKLCQNCHSVVFDRNGDGKIEKGPDLVLQNLFSEWESYRAAGGGSSCVDCHMPVGAGDRAADAALVPFEQDQDAPPRKMRSHRFVGPDYPIDDTRLRDLTKGERVALLASAARLNFVAGSVRSGAGRVQLGATVQNIGAGHNLPGGFAFVRQMWLALEIFDASGRALASSGALADASDDLCDNEVLQPGRALKGFAKGCTDADRALVNFQQRLLDRVEVAGASGGVPKRDARGEPVLVAAEGADEVVVQHLTSGAVARVRPADGSHISPLIPGETRRFDYDLPVPAGSRPARVSLRLLFRAVPPYFLRALASQQTAADGARVDSFIGNIEIVEMAHVEARIE